MSLVNMAARQRMLSQRMVLQTVLAASGDRDKLAAARKSFQLFCESQKQLRATDKSFDDAGAELIRKTYEGPNGAGAVIDRFMKLMTTMLQDIADKNLPRIERGQQALVNEVDGVLDALNSATSVFDSLSRNKTDRMMQDLTAIVSDIQSVAKEAKVVSFNAQVIAARVGHQGREFAVVANVLSGISTEIDGLSRKAIELAARARRTT